MSKNHRLGFGVPYCYGSQKRMYRPDFIVLIDDGQRPKELLHLVLEVKGYRSEEAREKNPRWRTTECHASTT